jgi:hypothetical protein
VSELFLSDKIELHAGDCLAVLATLPENSIDACVTDPPYFLTSIVKRFGADGAASAKFGKDGRFSRLSGGFMNARWDKPETPPIDPGFAHWMAGFIDGEGCFSVHKKTVNGCETYDCQFSITLRADDKPILIEMQQQLGGIGSIADRPGRDDGKPQARYCVSSKAHCQRLRAVLMAFPLRAKKARDFEIWCHALDAWVDHTPGSGWDDVAYYRKALMAVRNVGSVHRPERLFFYRVGRELLRVLKPGAHLLMFGGTRTYHHMVCGLEDAGFEIRDSIQYLFGSGFPKSLDVSKAIDKAVGAERKVVGSKPTLHRGVSSDHEYGFATIGNIAITTPATDAARQWEGWGTALKPACEPIVLARKPLSEPTVAANVLRWGTGALNVDGCRVEANATDIERARVPQPQLNSPTGAIYNFKTGEGRNGETFDMAKGRWPANVIHDGSDEVVGLFPDTQSQGHVPRSGGTKAIWANGREIEKDFGSNNAFSDSGSAARFFYTAKADSTDRIGSKHPTVKPLDLMQYLIRLVTPPGGLVLDCFAGTGTTGEAAYREGCRAVLIEREEEYLADIRRRMALVLAGPEERARESIKAKVKDKPADHGPLFAKPYDPTDDLRQSVNLCLATVKERMAKGGPAWPKDESA